VIGATFSDTLPVGALSWIWTCAPDLGATCIIGTVAGPGVFTDTVDIPAGKHIVYTAVTTISALAVGPLTNTASITAPLPAYPDPDLVNNTKSDIDTP
jgi:hypothetical protein